MPTRETNQIKTNFQLYPPKNLMNYEPIIQHMSALFSQVLVT